MRREHDTGIGQLENWFNYGAIVSLILFAILMSGCDTLRFAPTEMQKRNAYLHQRTTQLAARKAQQEQTSMELLTLTHRAERQSEAMTAYFGLPKILPETDSTAEVLSTENERLTRAARTEALERPNPWDVADHIMEVGLALAGVIGGIYGHKLTGAIRRTRKQSRALREIVESNERFKRNYPEMSNAFKENQKQNIDTRTLVAEMR